MRVSPEATDGDPATFPDPDRYDVTRPNLRQQLASVLAGCPASAWTRHGAEGRRTLILRRPEAVWAN